LRKLFSLLEKDDQQAENRKHPTNGPAQVEKCKIRQQREHNIHPGKAKAKQKYQCRDSRGYGPSHSPEGSTDDIIDAADKVGAGNDNHFLSGKRNDFPVRRHQRRQLRGESSTEKAKGCAQRDRDQGPFPDRLHGAL